MLKKKLGTISTMLVVFLLLAPAAQTLPSPSPLFGVDVAASSVLAHWWDLLAGGAKGHAPARRAVKPKNGCGIDPQGQPTCIVNPPGGPPESTTPPPPPAGDGSGS